jgi:hypothetical protein
VSFKYPRMVSAPRYAAPATGMASERDHAEAGLVEVSVPLCRRDVTVDAAECIGVHGLQ